MSSDMDEFGDLGGSDSRVMDVTYRICGLVLASGPAPVRIHVRIPFGFLPHGGIEIITPD